MPVHALHKGIQYELEEVAKDEWQWSFEPPVGPRRTGTVVGEAEWAMVMARRAIEVWHEVNERPKAA
jgi:hypothetical protein